MIAYLLARGRALNWLFEEEISGREKVYLGLLLGLVGLTEVIFPGARYPYVTHTLLITFASLIGGLRVGMIAAITVTFGVFLFQAKPGIYESALTMFASVIIGSAIGRLFGNHNRLLRGLLTGMGVQTGIVFLHYVPAGMLHESHWLAYPLVSIPANGFGVMLLQLIVSEALVRANSERHKIEAERSHTLMIEAQLTALRARIKPHFLFNALTSIAALCRIAPDKAEAAILSMSQLMRRALDERSTTSVCLDDEMQYVRAYLEIEQHRLGNHLLVQWHIDPSGVTIHVPAFGLQTLVENAIIHGIANSMEPGTIRIVVRCRLHRTLIAVTDNGIGMSPEQRTNALASKDSLEHGLQITTQQLVLLYGKRARVRLFSREGVGTIAAFLMPSQRN